MEFQGRMIPIVDDQGRRTKATALTALAVRTAASDTVQVKNLIVSFYKKLNHQYYSQLPLIAKRQNLLIFEKFQICVSFS